jgi:hypothetical protein
MKKLLGILALGLLWCNVGFAENYEELMKKANTATGKDAIEVLELAKEALDFERSFLKECLNDLKIYRDKKVESCLKFKDRYDGLVNLTMIFTAHLKSEFYKISNKLDSGEKLEYTNGEHLMKTMNNYDDALKLNIKTLRKINLLMENL